MEEVMSMTGRLPFWTALINEGLPKEPWLGFGFMRIDYKEYFQSTHTYPGKMTHNTFMQVLMNLGFVGLTIVIFQLIFTFRGIQRETKEKRLMLYCLFIPLLINSLTEFGIFGESNYGILFYQLIIFYISFKKHPILTRAQKIFLEKRRPELFRIRIKIWGVSEKYVILEDKN
jgi:O-antigen ligase